MVETHSGWGRVSYKGYRRAAKVQSARYVFAYRPVHPGEWSERARQRSDVGERNDSFAKQEKAGTRVCLL